MLKDQALPKNITTFGFNRNKIQLALTYQDTVDWLFQQFPAYQKIGASAYKPGLENVHLLLNHFGNPHHHLKFIHVAGTNGKGSTCSMLASILKEAGQTVGLFTSPHIHDFRERIRVNGEMATEQFVIDQVQAIQSAQLTIQPSFFEISFLLALLYFQQQNCSVCVIETGLGGRLDATNCIQPEISLITNISIEHTQFLGDTIAAIAREKAGIIKANTPVVIGEYHPEAAPVFKEVATAQHAPIFFASEENIEVPINFPLLGNYQHANYRLVHKALDCLQHVFPVSEKAIELGLKNLNRNSGFYGRMQVVEQAPQVIFDVSHNEAGMKATLDYFKDYKHLVVIYGSSADKDLDKIFQLFPKHFTYFFTEFSNERSATIEKLKHYSEKYEISGQFFQSPQEALRVAKTIVNKEDTILVLGSFFLIADFF